MTTALDLRLLLHNKLSESGESSEILLAKAGIDGTLQLLTSAWERVLGYRRREFNGKTLFHLMWCNPRSAAAAVAAILDSSDMGPVDLRVRCRNGLGKTLRLHRLYDKHERMIYILAEEAPREPAGVIHARTERRAGVRDAHGRRT